MGPGAGVPHRGTGMDRRRGELEHVWIYPIVQYDLEKEMATHCSARAWRIPWTEEPGRLQSTGSRRVGHE